MPSVFIKNLNLFCRVGRNYWNRPNPTPVSYKLSASLQLPPFDANDDLNSSVSYADVSNLITNQTVNASFPSSVGILDYIAGTFFTSKIENVGLVKKLDLRLDDDKFHFKLGNLGISRSFLGASSAATVSAVTAASAASASISLTNLKLLTKIGIFPFERERTQFVSVDLKLDLNQVQSLAGDDFNNYLFTVVDELSSHIESTEFLTVEALSRDIIAFLSEREIIDIELKISKLNAVLNSECVGVAVSSAVPRTTKAPKTPNTLENSTLTPPITPQTRPPTTAYISFGSNINPISNILTALDSLSSHVTITGTSSLYKTAPMYYENQSPFVNGVVRIETSLSPLSLLKLLKSIEYGELNRVKPFQNAPRTIDLDIILYGDTSFSDKSLTIPHPRMLERSFVLDPLTELLPSSTEHPLGMPILRSEDPSSETVIPVWRPYKQQFDLWHRNYLNLSSKTIIMGIINLTKDSFSDGGKNFELDDAFSSAVSQVKSGAACIDIGSTSTKPGSVLGDGADAEIAMIVPLVKKIRESEDPAVKDVLISIDTFHSAVARAAIAAGADIINDVSMGMYDPQIYDVVAESKCLYIINHTRGVPLNMKTFTDYDGSTESTVARELAVCINRAYRSGVKKWQIVLDPGLGFAKSVEQNIELVTCSNSLRKYEVEFDDFAKEKTFNEKHGLDPWPKKPVDIIGYGREKVSFSKLPVLIGPSRKRFIQSLTKEELDIKRGEKVVMGTGGVVVAAIGGGADIVRVHDVDEMAKMGRLGDAMYGRVD